MPSPTFDRKIRKKGYGKQKVEEGTVGDMCTVPVARDRARLLRNRHLQPHTTCPRLSCVMRVKSAVLRSDGGVGAEGTISRVLFGVGYKYRLVYIRHSVVSWEGCYISA